MSNRTDPRRRSRSPVAHSDSPISKSRRTRSPRVSHRHHSIHKRSHAHRLAILPFQASNLSKHDFGIYKPIFKLYLDIQKQLILEELSKDEVRGRWKRFVGKWYVSSPTFCFCSKHRTVIFFEIENKSVL